MPTDSSIAQAPVKVTSESPTDYTAWSTSALIDRITILESQVRAQTLECTSSSLSVSHKRMPRRANPFDPSKYSARFIALKLAYLGARYNGLEHSNNNFTPLPTLEEVLWKALRKARLISPALEEGSDESYDVLFEKSERVERYVQEGKKLHLNWEGCQYSKCGRTDKGVSAFGQVIGVRVRSAKPLEKKQKDGKESGVVEAEVLAEDNEMPGIDVDDLSSDSISKPFDPVADELPYVSILNSILPPDVRVLAWCPNPPDNFDARFSCQERRYRYFFTNPAFCPTPGPLGMKFATGQAAKTREGWLDIDAMRMAAKKLEGLHDFRNFCKVDPSKQMTSFERRITFADIEEVRAQAGPTAFNTMVELSQDGSARSTSESLPSAARSSNVTGPKVYAFAVHGSAFLWHQVRCMVALLFLVGQGLEQPSLIDDLLDVQKHSCKPAYEMASDSPLVLWDCSFSTADSQGEDTLQWVYAGDAAATPSLTTKGDSKYGTGGVVDELWTQWRKAKIDEILASSLLELTVSRSDGSDLERGGYRDPAALTFRSQKIFDGRDTARLVGDYVSVLQKPSLVDVDVQNSRWRVRKNARLLREQGRAKGVLLSRDRDQNLA